MFLYPSGSDFAKRDFLFRISSAKIEVEESKFTPFKGFSRVIMPLTDSLQIRHEGRYTKDLQTFETDAFEGDWNTNSLGKCTDFNVIFRPELKVDLELVIRAKNEEYLFSRQPYEQFAIAFLWEGEAHFEDEKFAEKDMLVQDNDDYEIVSFVPQKDAIFVVVRIW